MIRVFSYIIAILITATSGPSVAFAGAQNESPVTVDQLLVQTDETDENENLTDEEKFTRARDGLEKAIALTLEKLDVLTADLEGRTFDEESTEQKLKSAYLEELAEFRTYHEERAALVPDALTIEGVQALAQEIKLYRDETYTPAIEHIVEFILIFYSEDVVGVANERLEKINADIEKLKLLGLLEPESFRERFEKIDTLLSEAEELRTTAKELVLNPPIENATDTVEAEAEADTPEPEVLNTEIAEATTTSEEAAEEIMGETSKGDDGEETAPAVQTPRDMLEVSLTNVKSVYEIFLEIGSSVKEILGLAQ